MPKIDPSVLSRAIGATLVALGLAADCYFTAKGMTAPAVVSSVLTAGLGLVVPSMIGLGSPKTPIEAMQVAAELANKEQVK